MNDIRVTQSQLKPENLEQSELEYSFFLSNIHILIRNIHIPTTNIHIPIVNIHIPTSLKLSIQYSIFRFLPRYCKKINFYPHQFRVIPTFARIFLHVKFLNILK